MFEAMGAGGHESVTFAADPAAGYRAIIAIHSTVLGPAVGGCRAVHYPDEAAALTDALRLARGMTYKCAMAGVPLGGGKSVVLMPADTGAVDRAALFAAHGRAVARLAGRYITAEDVGTTPADMEIVRRMTTHVAGLPGHSGDPSPHTARGVFRAMMAAVRAVFGQDDLAGRTVAVQGLGAVGWHLAVRVRDAGGALVVADLDPGRVERASEELGARAVPPDAVLSAPADIVAPCAMGGVLDDRTIAALAARVVCGAANNQLAEPRHAEALARKGVLYVPDYVANAGGMINGCRELLDWSPERSAAAVDAIGERVGALLAHADRSGITPAAAADALAEVALARGPATAPEPPGAQTPQALGNWGVVGS